MSSNLLESNDILHKIFNLHVVFLVWYLENQFNKIILKNCLSGHCLLQFSFSEIRLLFLIDGIAITFHVLFLFHLCMSRWLIIIWSPVVKLSGSYVQIFTNHNSKFLEKGSKNRESNFCQKKFKKPKKSKSWKHDCVTKAKLKLWTY